MNEGDRRLRRLHAAPLDRFLHGAAAVEPRARAAPVPAFARPVVFLGARRPSLRDSAASALPTASRRCRRCGTRACTGCRRLRCRPGRAGCRCPAAGGRCGRRAWPGPGRRLAARWSCAAGSESARASAPARARCVAPPVSTSAPATICGRCCAHGFAHLVVVTQPVARAAREQVVPARARPGCDPHAGAASARRVVAHVARNLARRSSVCCATPAPAMS